MLLSWEGVVVPYIFVYTQTHNRYSFFIYFIFFGRGYNQAFLLHVFIPYLSSPDGIHTKLWSLKTQHYHFLVLMASVHLEDPSRKSSRCTGIRQRRYGSKERKEGGSECSIVSEKETDKTRFQGNCEASDTFFTGTMLAHTSKKPKKTKAYTEKNTTKHLFNLFTWQTSDTTSLLRFHSAVLSAQWERLEKKKETTCWPSATSAVYVSFFCCSGWRGW